jgi:hypothetical protein
MIFNFTCPVQMLDGPKLRHIAEIEARAHLAPVKDDPGEWTPVAIEVADIASGEWIIVTTDSAWHGLLMSELLRPERQSEIDGEWIAHRNGEGDAALYGQEA